MTKITTLAAAMSFAALAPMAASAAGGVEVGLLTCNQVDQSNFIILSNATFDCTYKSVTDDVVGFTATINNFGIDLSTSNEEALAWLVFAPTTEIDAGSLQGRYVGASADVAVGVGIGAKVLIGGFEKSFALQPASLTGSRGIGAAVGVETLNLTLKN